VGKKTRSSLVLTCAAVAGALAFAAPASADPLPPPGGWMWSQDFGSTYLCRSAGLAGDFFGRWREGDWQCVGTTLYVRQNVSAPPAG
jgi:hypothetical protein